MSCIGAKWQCIRMKLNTIFKYFLLKSSSGTDYVTGLWFYLKCNSKGFPGLHTQLQYSTIMHSKDICSTFTMPYSIKQHRSAPNWSYGFAEILPKDVKYCFFLTRMTFLLIELGLAVVRHRSLWRAVSSECLGSLALGWSSVPGLRLGKHSQVSCKQVWFEYFIA